MQTTKGLKRRALAFALAAASVAVIACGSNTSPANDAGSVADAQPDVAESGLAEAGKDAAPDAAPDGAADAANPLTISPTAPTAKGCSTDIVTFTASGGTPPYTWTTSDTASNDLVVTSATQATWEDNADNFCGVGGTITVTVKDSTGATATATITVTPG
jgi:hypothetical protein